MWYDLWNCGYSMIHDLTILMYFLCESWESDIYKIFLLTSLAATSWISYKKEESSIA